MDGGYAYLRHQGQQQRRADQHTGGIVDDHAHDKQKQVDDNEDHGSVGR
ncbi:hypothetical protein SDC9_173237 [bioreactor metagenome]|uniref:Uncharacterized protein n=1 Tax=bioreactor metagenome TaxID=1076179 RepID=A0A645GFV9_9ZZZZ